VRGIMIQWARQRKKFFEGRSIKTHENREEKKKYDFGVYPTSVHSPGGKSSGEIGVASSRRHAGRTAPGRGVQNQQGKF